MADRPRVTVVIPTYNRAGLLMEAIQSALAQSYRDLEVLVCDDGSSEDTGARVEALDPRVRYLKLPHAGRPGAPRNRGIEAARGELIAFLDDDDLWEPDKLARQIELIDEQGLNLVYTDRQLLPGGGVPAELVISPPLAGPDRLLDLVVAGHFPHVCTLLASSDLLREVGGFDETLATGEDLDLCLRLSLAARAGKVQAALVVIRRRPESLSNRSEAEAFQNAIRVLERALATIAMRRAQRKRCRATLAALNTSLAAIMARNGDMPGARRAAAQAVRYRPVSRAAWAALAKARSAA